MSYVLWSRTRRASGNASMLLSIHWIGAAGGGDVVIARDDSGVRAADEVSTVRLGLGFTSPLQTRRGAASLRSVSKRRPIQPSTQTSGRITGADASLPRHGPYD